MLVNVHEIVQNIDDLTDAEFGAVKMKFFEIFGDDKNPAGIEVVDTERFEQRIFVRCQFQNNSFVVHIQH
jgi:hypothetical protein